VSNLSEGLKQESWGAGRLALPHSRWPLNGKRRKAAAVRLSGSAVSVHTT